MLKRISESSKVQFVIDEAHCVIEHQYFRKAWDGVADILKRDFPDSSIMMVSATLSEKDAHTLCEKMKIQWNDIAVIRSLSFARPKIFLDVYEKKKTKKEINYDQIIEEIDKNISGRCIIYCASPRICEELKTYVANKINKYEVDLFHGDLTGERKNLSLTKWKTGVTKIIVATSAFGMGINTPDVNLIIHFNFPLSLGQYVQESGRAGRDGTKAKSVIFYSKSELKFLYGIISEKREDMGDEETLERRAYLKQGIEKLHEVFL